MRSRDVILCGALGCLLMAGCGGSTHTTTAPSGGFTTSATTSAATQPPAGMLGRVLTNNELTGFTTSPTTVTSGIPLWVAATGLPRSQRQAEAKRLERLGFLRAVREDLNQGSTPGISIVEQFRTPAGSRAEVVYQANRFPAESAGQGKITHFIVPGIPGARGFGVVSAGDMGGINVDFARGSYYYLVGQELTGQGMPSTSIRNLIAAAEHLYQRVNS